MSFSCFLFSLLFLSYYLPFISERTNIMLQFLLILLWHFDVKDVLQKWFALQEIMINSVSILAVNHGLFMDIVTTGVFHRYSVLGCRLLWSDNFTAHKITWSLMHCFSLICAWKSLCVLCFCAPNLQTEVTLLHSDNHVLTEFFLWHFR